MAGNSGNTPLGAGNLGTPEGLEFKALELNDYSSTFQVSTSVAEANKFVKIAQARCAMLLGQRCLILWRFFIILFWGTAIRDAHFRMFLKKILDQTA